MATHDTPGLFTMLTRTRAATRAVMVFERLWPLVLPLVLVAGLYLTVAWFGLFRILPDNGRIALALAFTAAGLAALWPLIRLRRPSTAEINRRIEASNALSHEPVTVQDEALSTPGDPFAEALWHEHRRRMAERLRDLETDLPRTGVPARDPWGLRAGVALLTVIAFAWSLGPHGGTIADPFSSHATTETIPPRVDAWVTPPAYTGRAPIFLTSEANRTQTAFSVPETSVLTLRIIGGSGTETLSFTDVEGTKRTLPDKTGTEPAQNAETTTAPREFDHPLSDTGTVTLATPDTAISSWQFTVTPDNPPVIAMLDTPQRAVNGALGLRYTIEDDYGPVSAEADFLLLEDGGDHARPLYEAPEMPLSLPRRRADPPAARSSRDLTAHPWSGLAVELELIATDASGQIGRSEPYRMRLPQRIFTNPLAKAIIEQRQLLALDAGMARDVRDMLDAIILRPEDTLSDTTHFLALTSVRTRLSLATTDDAKRDIVDYMWEVALGIEDGDLSAAERRLRQAQEALEDALERGASDEEIERLMAELRDAISEFMRELAEQAMRNQDLAQTMPQGQEMTRSDLDRMLDQIEEMARSGAQDQAREMLDQLRQMMDNLRMAQRQQGNQNQGQNAMRQQMDELGELMRRQQELMNETFRLDQMPRNNGQQPGPGEQEGQDQQGQNGRPDPNGQQGRPGGQQGQGMTPGELAEALRQLQEAQRGLRGDLDALQRGLEGLGMQPSDDFGEAGRQMGRAEDNLGQGRGSDAVGNQGDALDALRRGAQDMMNQMHQALQQQGDGDGQSDPSGRRNAGDRDPLGRPRATTGPDFGDTVDVPDEIDVQRAREILEAIRRRLGDVLSPQIEKDYLERLLQMR